MDFFAHLSSDELRKLASDAQRTRRDPIEPLADQNKRFYDGDHWQSGTQWIGPLPAATSLSVSDAMREIERGFVFSNKIAEIVDRHVLAAIGRQPAWTIGVSRPLSEGERPTAEEQALIEEADALLTVRWDKANWLKKLREAAVTLKLTGVAPLRLFVPRGLTQIDENGNSVIANPDGSIPTLEQAINLIFLQLPNISQALIAIDEDTQQEISIYQYERDQRRFYEISYADDSDTILIELSEDQEAVRHRLEQTNGHLMLFVMADRALVTESVRSMQRMLNKALTRQSRNDDANALGEVTYIGLEPPGEFEVDPISGDIRRGEIVKMDVGPGARNFLMPAAQRDADGNLVFDENGQPIYVPSSSIHVREPTDPGVLLASQRSAEEGIYKEAHQLHALISGDATASGTSRIQARADFEASLLGTVEQLNAAGRWLLETTLHLAALFAGMPGRYAGLRVDFNCVVDSGPLSAEERNAIIAEYKAGLESREGAMQRLGRQDPELTIQQVRAEREEDSERQQATLGQALLRFDRGAEPLPEEG